MLNYTCSTRARSVAVNTPPCHGGDRRFEPGRARHIDLSILLCFRKCMYGQVGKSPRGCQAEALTTFGPLTNSVPEGETAVSAKQVVLICGDRLKCFPVMNYPEQVATVALKGFCANCPNRNSEPSTET